MSASSKAIAEDKSYSIREFCLLEGISLATYYKMRKAGYGPREMRLPGSSFVRISAAARAEWQEKLEQLARSTAIAIESATRSTARAAAGRKGAQSPNHPCRRPRD
jgi:predicted DNA-binding transcriptional regulator AlpA